MAAVKLILPYDTNLTNTNLQGVNISGADLTDTLFTGTDGKAHGRYINHPICATLPAN